MNIKKTNQIGISWIEKNYKGLRSVSDKIIKDETEKTKIKVNNTEVQKLTDSNLGSMIRMDIFEHQKDSKTLRISKSVMDACKFIDIDSIKENIDVNELNFTSLNILLDNDTSGLIKILRFGSDFDFIYLKNLNNLTEACFNSYSFLTKEFNLKVEDVDSIFVVKLLAYLYYGDITTKLIPPKSEVKINFANKIQNPSSITVSFVDSLWKQRITTEGFSVKGHFRLQPIGVNREKRKLIWIEEFKKEGYNRKATIELQ